jgi:hypothetical protein
MSPVQVNPYWFAVGESASFSAQTGAFNIGTGAATTTVAVTGVGFQPTAVIFWWNGLQSATGTVSSTTSHLRAGYGFAVSTSQRATLCGISQDDAATAISDSHVRDDACIVTLDVGTAVTAGKADLQSMDAGGFTLVIDEQFDTDLRIKYLALGGGTLTAHVGSYTATATGSLAETGVGFEPDAVFFLCSTGTAANSNTSDMRIGFGCATGASNQWVVAVGSDDGVGTTVTQRYLRADECVAALDFNFGAISSRQSFTSMDADGFTVNVAEKPGTDVYTPYLALGGISAVAGRIQQASSAGSSSVTTHGFTPAAVILCQHGEDDNASDTHRTQNQFGLGVGTSTSNRQVAMWRDPTGFGTSSVVLHNRDDAIGVCVDNAGSVDAQTDLTQMTSATVELTMDVTVARQIAHAYCILG